VQSPRTACGGVPLNMLKTNATAWRLHSVLCSALHVNVVATLWGLLERCGRVVGAPCARCTDALLIVYLDSAFAMYFDNNISHHKIYSNIIIITNAN